MPRIDLGVACGQMFMWLVVGLGIITRFHTARVFFYLVIPPTAWVGAALVEKLLDRLL
jgi:hypothetical protein